MGNHKFEKKSLDNAKEWAEAALKQAGENSDISQGPTKKQLEDRLKVINRLLDGLNDEDKKQDPNPGIK